MTSTREIMDNDAQKMAQILQAKEELPLPLRLAIDRALQHHQKPPTDFLSEVEDFFVEWLARVSPHCEGGLDDTRDTPQQVELALRYFPQVLLSQGSRGDVPLYSLLRSVSSISFLPLLARLGAELGVFEPHQRGGLVLAPAQGLVPHRYFASAPVDVFFVLATGNYLRKKANQQLVDRKILQVIQELRNTNLMASSDIVDFHMMWYLCLYRKHSSFPKEIFLYLVHWNPRVLVSTTPIFSLRSTASTSYDRTTLSQWLKTHFFPFGKAKALAEIRMIFGLLLKYYPEDIGFLFHRTLSVKFGRLRPLQPLYDEKSYDEWHRQHREIIYRGGICTVGKTYWASPFEVACNDFGSETILSVVNELVGQQMQADANFIRKALVRTSTVCPEKESLHREGVQCGDDGLEQLFFLIQRDPTVLQKELSCVADAY